MSRTPAIFLSLAFGTFAVCLGTANATPLTSSAPAIASAASENDSIINVHRCHRGWDRAGRRGSLHRHVGRSCSRINAREYRSQRKRLATAITMTEAKIMRLERDMMLQVLQDEPTFSEMFIAHILSRNARVEEDLVDQLFNSTEKRLARTLLLLANFGKTGRPEPVIAKISQETLAEMIGTTRSRVSHFMNKFRDLGLIDYNGRIEVHSSLLTVVLYERPSGVHSPK